MFDFWFELPRIGRLIFSLALIAIAVFIFFATGGTRIAVGMGVVGAVTLLANGAGANKDGYNF